MMTLSEKIEMLITEYNYTLKSIEHLSEAQIDQLIDKLEEDRE